MNGIETEVYILLLSVMLLLAIIGQTFRTQLEKSGYYAQFTFVQIIGGITLVFMGITRSING